MEPWGGSRGDLPRAWAAVVRPLRRPEPRLLGDKAVPAPEWPSGRSPAHHTGSGSSPSGLCALSPGCSLWGRPVLPKGSYFPTWLFYRYFLCRNWKVYTCWNKGFEKRADNHWSKKLKPKCTACGSPKAGNSCWRIWRPAAGSIVMNCCLLKSGVETCWCQAVISLKSSTGRNRPKCPRSCVTCSG